MRIISKRSSPTSQVRLRSVSKNWKNTSSVQGPVSVAMRSVVGLAPRVENVHGLRAILEANIRIVDIIKKEQASVVAEVLKKLKFPIKDKQFVMTARAGTICVKQYVHLPTLDMGTTVITDGKITMLLDENDTRMVNVVLVPALSNVDHRYLERLALLMTTYVLAVDPSRRLGCPEPVVFDLDYTTPHSMYPAFRAALQLQQRSVREMRKGKPVQCTGA